MPLFSPRYPQYPGMRPRPSVGLLILFIVFGLYLINYPFSFVKIPAAVTGMDKWIILVSGVLLIVGAINHFTRILRGY